MLTKKVSVQVELARNHLETLRRCGGFYQCPKQAGGKRLGPLVGYAGKYKDADGAKHQYVGEVYVNFARAEEYPHVLRHYAEAIRLDVPPDLLMYVDVFCGAPLGGYSFADKLGEVYDRRVIKAEKKVTAAAKSGMREQSTVVFARHRPRSNEGVVIVEDVCNNFSTTDQLITLIEQADAMVVAIVCFLNRSMTVEDEYQAASNGSILPVVSLVRLPFDQYRQDEPTVAEDIAKGNIVLKPKDDWPRLMAAIEAASQE